MPRRALEMTPSADRWRRLQELGAAAFPHVNGTLAKHLQGTGRMLRSFGARDALCVAGFWHAVYGTDGIRGSLSSLDDRAAIAELIGVESEALVYLYGACARDAFHPRIGTQDALRFVDRYTKAEYPITVQQLRDFCELTLANELELMQNGQRFRAKHAPELDRFFGRMRGLVSERAWRTMRAILSPPLSSCSEVDRGTASGH
jgi:hypothetical protein